MEYSIAIPIFVFVLYGMIFLVQKFLEKVDPSIEEIDMSRVLCSNVIQRCFCLGRYHRKFLAEIPQGCTQLAICTPILH